jgi:hypothetical protein
MPLLTERLQLRRSQADLDQYATIAANPDVTGTSVACWIFTWRKSSEFRRHCADAAPDRFALLDSGAEQEDVDVVGFGTRP